jgi:hypothetical protein
MRVTVPVDEAVASGYLPPTRPDGSGLGVNYADHVLKLLKLTLPDGRKLSARRRGLKITIVIGDRAGEAIMRRLDHGPDVSTILAAALAEAAHGAGVALTRAPGAIHLDL